MLFCKENSALLKGQSVGLPVLGARVVPCWRQCLELRYVWSSFAFLTSHTDPVLRSRKMDTSRQERVSWIPSCLPHGLTFRLLFTVWSACVHFLEKIWRPHLYSSWKGYQVWKSSFKENTNIVRLLEFQYIVYHLRSVTTSCLSLPPVQVFCLWDGC